MATLRCVSKEQPENLMEVSDFLAAYHTGKKVMCNTMWPSVDDTVKVMLHDEWEWTVGAEVALALTLDAWRSAGEIKLYRLTESNVARRKNIVLSHGPHN